MIINRTYIESRNPNIKSSRIEETTYYINISEEKLNYR